MKIVLAWVLLTVLATRLICAFGAEDLWGQSRRLLREVNEEDRLFFEDNLLDGWEPGTFVRCLSNSDCPSTYPFCEKVRKDQLQDQSLWYEGLRGCFQCTERDSSLCAAPTDKCVDGQCLMCRDNTDCLGSNTTQCILGVCAQCQFDDSLAAQNPYNFFVTPQCGGSTSQAPSCVQYGTFQGQCVQCVTRDLLTGVQSSCGKLNPFCSYAAKPNEQPMCRQCGSSAECISKSNRFCDANFNCIGCSSSAECEPNQICFENQCIACTSNDTSACPVSAPICASVGTSNATCVQCVNDTTCAANAVEKYCSSENTCVECVTSSQCTNGVCSNNSCVDCLQNSDCNVGGTKTPYCNTQENICQICLDGVAGQCPLGSYCTNGTCVPGCQTNADCDSANPVCNQQTKTCQQCTATNTTLCVDPNPVCNTATGTCVGCLDSSNCTSPTGTCDLQNNVCVGCVDSGDCTGSQNPVCDTALKKCVQCLNDGNCTNPLLPVCDLFDGRCVACLNNTDCLSGDKNKFCSLTTNTCVGCLTNADCANIGTQTCLNSTCQVQCTSNTDCTDPEQPNCDTVVGKCVQCTSSANCTGQPKTPICDKATGLTYDQCLGCKTNADCSGEDKFCDPLTNTCKQCLTNRYAEIYILWVERHTNNAPCFFPYSDCTDPGNSVCDADLQTCVPCNAANPNACISPSSVCDTDQRACVECLNNSTCAASNQLTPICLGTTCVQCVVQSDCPLGTYCNVTSNTCIPGCNDSNDCTSPNQPVCDVSTRQCVSCTQNADCGGTTPICELADPAYINQCVGCSTSQDCAATEKCNQNTKSCQRCITSSDCVGNTAGPFCETSFGGQVAKCTECLVDSDCGSGNKCLVSIDGNRCVACITNQDCPNGVCDSTNTCQPCLVDNDCGANSQTPKCDTSPAINKCVQCLGQLDCASQPETPVCDLQDNICVSCRTGADCPSINPVCLTNINGGSTCVQCTPGNSAQCTGKTPYCSAERNTCVSCTDNSHCTSSVNSVCRSGTCAPECTTDRDCQWSPNSYCLNGKCSPPLTLQNLIERVVGGSLECEEEFPNTWARFYGNRFSCRLQPNGCCHCPSCGLGCVFKDCSARNPSRKSPGGHFG